MALIAIDPLGEPVRQALDELLADYSTKKNIIFATDSYAERGGAWGAKKPITREILWSDARCPIQPRALKDSEDRQQRTKKRAEVFTPSWICRMMNDFLDEDFFGAKDVFFRADGDAYRPTEGKISFPEGADWRTYVDSRRLEITCGEAPYLFSRYDTETGEIIPTGERVGLLDRKMRVVNENTETEEEWLRWTTRAFQSVYGYEYQGDSLLIARINMLLSFTEYSEDRRGRQATEQELKEFARIAARNLWQMDGLKGTIPMGALYEPVRQVSMFDLFEPPKEEPKPCVVYDWRSKKNVPYYAFREGGQGSMKFDYIIGNPPYQEETDSESTRMPPIYNNFMDEAYNIASVVELITPARFLFNAGQTPKSWNQKMLNDPYLSVLYYEQDASKIFPNTDIKGGVAVTYRNSNKKIGPILAFVPYPELQSVLLKSGAKDVNDSLTDIADSSNVYDLKNIYTDHPDYTQYIGDGGRHSQLKTNVLNINPIFTDEPTEPDDYMVYGLVNGKRGNKYCHRRYIKSEHKSLFKYKVLVPKATGSGKFGDALPEMMVAPPATAFTQTYISIGTFDTEIEADHLIKYLKTKFSRSLLYVLKVTQDNLPSVWRFIPKQDFTKISDIDWSQSVANIDQQLYHKYNLSPDEIAFIESHVKEME